MITGRALVTGGAGFIGSHLVDRLLAAGWQVTVVDCFDGSYRRLLKEANVSPHLGQESYELVRADIRDLSQLRASLSGAYDVIVHLAAKTGVRASFGDPDGYREVNVGGTRNLLELARQWGVEQFVFASSSSVYGEDPNVPWKEDTCSPRPISPYAQTKLDCELLGRSHSQLHGIRFLALRFFTVYGPRQRPDLAISKFCRLLIEGKPLPIYGDGSSSRDYTYVADIVKGIQAAISYGRTPFEAINLGNGQPVPLWQMIRTLEELLGITAELDYRGQQAGDAPATWASLEKAGRLLAYEPTTDWRSGLARYVEWFAASATETDDHTLPLRRRRD